MSDIPAIPEAVQWHEGMLLSPHHFQQAALRADLLLNFHLRQLAPFNWGVLSLQIDPARLAMGTFRVLSLEAILPDGLPVFYPGGETEALELDLLPMAAQLRDEPAKVYLAVPARRPDLVSGTGEAPRFRSVEGAPVIDENTGDNAISVPRLRPNLMLFAGTRPPAKYSAMPIAEVSFENDVLQLSHRFLAPQLGVTPASPLGGLCLKLAQRLRHKATLIADRVQAGIGSGRDGAMAGSSEAVRALAGGLPPLEAALNSGVAHPFTIYLLLASIAGAVAPLGQGMVPPIFERYDHDDVALSYRPMLAFIERMLETISESHEAIGFALEENAFRLKLEPKWLTGGELLVGVRGRSGANESELAQWMEEALIGDSGQIPPMLEARIRGTARARIVETERLGIAPPRGTTLFRIAADQKFMAANGRLEISNPRDVGGSRRPQGIVLYVPTQSGR